MNRPTHVLREEFFSNLNVKFIGFGIAFAKQWFNNCSVRYYSRGVFLMDFKMNFFFDLENDNLYSDRNFIFTLYSHDERKSA